MGEASGHTGEDLISLSLVIKDCQVAGGASHLRGIGLRPLPKLKNILSLRGSLRPLVGVSDSFSSESHLTYVSKESGQLSGLSSQVERGLRLKSPRQEILRP